MRKPIGNLIDFVNAKSWWMLGIVAWVAVSVLALGLILFLNWYRQSTDYPGALLRADDTTYKLSPLLSIRRDSAYLSGDRFNQVFNWYSAGFNLGPESYAQSGCALMARSFSNFNVIEQQMSVMVCDTPKGRMIFVMRSMTLKWR